MLILSILSVSDERSIPTSFKVVLLFAGLSSETVTEGLLSRVNTSFKNGKIKLPPKKTQVNRKSTTKDTTLAMIQLFISFLVFFFIFTPRF